MRKTISLVLQCKSQVPFTGKDLRVLFEKAVTSIPKENAHEIWHLYLQFEYSYGDLSSIIKIESRKSKLYPEADSSGILPLVNRFRYLNLWPCNNAELDSFGTSSAHNVVYSFIRVERLPEPKFEHGKEEKEDDVFQHGGKPNPKLAKFPRPDLSLLIPFKNETVMPQFGGVPEIIAQLIVNLPPASLWQGPLPDVDGIVTLLHEASLPPAPADHNVDTQPISTQQQKKRRTVEEEEEEEDMSSAAINAPPSNDLFRQRQRAKLHKKSAV